MIEKCVSLQSLQCNMSLAPKTPPRLALTIIIRQIESNHQNYLGRAVVFYFCIFVFSKKYNFRNFLYFVFLYFPKNTNSTLCIFLYFCIFQKMQIPHFAFFCILFVFFLYYVCIIFVFFGICTFWKIQKYKKMQSVEFVFLENTKIKNTKNAKVVFFEIQKCNINKNLRLVFVQKMQKKTRAHLFTGSQLSQL